MTQINTTNQMVREFARVLSNRPKYSKFNWPAHCEGKGAARNGESHHNNPYDPDLQPKDFKRWNDGYHHVVEVLTRNVQLAVIA